ncbi:Hypothetical protein SMAX5B_018226 [Scophthalmus maximus]|uniref:Uncharacterized protein n=1 Tax=Scophthalmus maximus TaxID=52904 RepID=A0A2U9CDG6_SCOMX|nr:Hypothetical protein SMAX5B_018226 [Scophthalmus maximus]
MYARLSRSHTNPGAAVSTDTVDVKLSVRLSPAFAVRRLSSPTLFCCRFCIAPLFPAAEPRSSRSLAPGEWSASPQDYHSSERLRRAVAATPRLFRCDSAAWSGGVG